MYVAIALSIVLIYVLWFSKEGFGKPSNKKWMAEQLVSNKEHLTKGLKTVQSKMPWVDPVVYEDARSLQIKNKLNMNNALSIFG